MAKEEERNEYLPLLVRQVRVLREREKKVILKALSGSLWANPSRQSDFCEISFKLEKLLPAWQPRLSKSAGKLVVVGGGGGVDGRAGILAV